MRFPVRGERLASEKFPLETIKKASGISFYRRHGGKSKKLSYVITKKDKTRNVFALRVV
jgi:hypothetical protein